MATTSDGKALDPDNPLDSPGNSSGQSAMTVHSVAYPMHMYPFSAGLSLVPPQPLRSKRRQVKNACTNCQKACKKCDDARPCLRCVKYGISEECVDSQRKERKKGIKRGPYKKRDGKDRAGSNVEQNDVSSQQGVPVSNSLPPPSSGPPLIGTYLSSLPPGYYGQYATPPILKSGENGHMYPQYITPVPQPIPIPTHPNTDGDHSSYPPHQFYPTFVTQYGHQVFPQFVMPRHDGLSQYMVIPYPGRHPAVSGPSEVGHIGHTRSDGQDSANKSG